MSKPRTAKTAPKRDLIRETSAAAKATRKARLDALLGVIQQRMVDVVADFWDIGQALGEILDEKLYVADGHKTFAAFLQANRLPSRAQAAKLIAVARSMPRKQALKLGPEKTYALLAFTRATPEADSPTELVDAGKRFAGKTAEQASLREIEASTRAQHEKNAAAKPKTAAQRARAREEASLRRAIAGQLKAAGLHGATIVVSAKTVRAEWPREVAKKRVEG